MSEIRVRRNVNSSDKLNTVSRENPFPIEPVTTEEHLGSVGGHPFWVTASMTRPADTTQYGAREVFSDNAGGLFVFKDIARMAGYGGQITGAILADSTSETVKPQVELWLFRKPPALVADNAAIAFTDADVLECIGIIQFGVEKAAYIGTASSNCLLMGEFLQGLPIDFVCIGTDLFGKAIVANTYTPVSVETWQFGLRGNRD
jgi:hypothetical protein